MLFFLIAFSTTNKDKNTRKNKGLECEDFIYHHHTPNIETR